MGVSILDIAALAGVSKSTVSAVINQHPHVRQETREKVLDAIRDYEPSVITRYILDVAAAFNRFYHETKILSEEDAKKQEGYIALLAVTKSVLEACIDMLGFEAPERM